MCFQHTGGTQGDVFASEIRTMLWKNFVIRPEHVAATCNNQPTQLRLHLVNRLSNTKRQSSKLSINRNFKLMVFYSRDNSHMAAVVQEQHPLQQLSLLRQLLLL